MAQPNKSTLVFRCYNDKNHGKALKVHAHRDTKFEGKFVPLSDMERFPGIYDVSKYGKSAEAEGFCAAMSVLWIEKTLQSGEVTDESQLGGVMLQGIAQAMYSFASKRGDLAGARKVLLERRNLEIDGTPLKQKLTRLLVSAWLQQLIGSPGMYYIAIPGHATAARTAIGNCYFFDPEDGSFRFANRTDFLDGMTDFLKQEYGYALGANKEWTAYKVKLA